MNQSGTPDRACSASSASRSRGHPVTPAHAASTASVGTGWDAFSARVTTGRETLSRLASAPGAAWCGHAACCPDDLSAEDFEHCDTRRAALAAPGRDSGDACHEHHQGTDDDLEALRGHIHQDGTRRDAQCWRDVSTGATAATS